MVAHSMEKKTSQFGKVWKHKTSSNGGGAVALKTVAKGGEIQFSFTSNGVDDEAIGRGDDMEKLW